MFNMERHMINKQHSLPNSTQSSTLGLHKNSQTISKVKPKIRIIHIFAPEIIKTDVDNFRELVQRLTGKPPETFKTRKIVPPKEKEKAPPPEMELRHGLHSQGFRERIKGEEEIWRGANSGGGFLGNFPEFDNGAFMADINGFPFLPLDASSHMDAYGEPPQLIA